MTPYSISLPLENSVNITSSMIGDDAKLLIRKVQSGVLINTIKVRWLLIFGPENNVKFDSDTHGPTFCAHYLQ